MTFFPTFSPSRSAASSLQGMPDNPVENRSRQLGQSINQQNMIAPSASTTDFSDITTNPTFPDRNRSFQYACEYLSSAPKGRRLEVPTQDQSYDSPEAATYSTPVSTPTKKERVRLSTQSYATLKEIGIPEKAIKKLEVVISKTTGNYAICGSSALAIHANNSQLLLGFEVGDLDIVYTGSTNIDSIALDLQGALGSPNTKANTTQGQILIAVLTTEADDKFKIDLVPKKEEFATEFIEMNGLSIASLSSLKTSYSCTARGCYGEKSNAAKAKLEMIQVLLDQEHS